MHRRSTMRIARAQADGEQTLGYACVHAMVNAITTIAHDEDAARSQRLTTPACQPLRTGCTMGSPLRNMVPTSPEGGTSSCHRSHPGVCTSTKGRSNKTDNMDMDI